MRRIVDSTEAERRAARRKAPLTDGAIAAAAPRFWAMVLKSETCWRWLGALTYKGYGRFCLEGRAIPAHRFAVMLRDGSVPRDLTVDHLCRNRACVRPDHMELVTVRENVLRGIGMTAHNARKTHCPAGHEYNEANTYRSADHKRSCRTCGVAATRAWRDRLAAAG